MCHTNPIWQTAAILKNKKSTYFHDYLTNFDELKNPIWQVAAILKN